MPEGGPVHVVLCDDVAPLRALTRFVLEELGTVRVVGETGDAQTAVELCREQRPDAVLLDLSMPGMDGLEAIPLLEEACPGVHVVVFSGFAADRMEELAIAQGAARYLEKGLELADVRAVLLDVCGHVAA